MINKSEQLSREAQIQEAQFPLRVQNLAREGKTEQLFALIRDGLSVNLADGSQNTLLMLACHYGHAATARMLLEQGAEVDKRNIRGQTPLGGVAYKGFDEVAAVLMENGADPLADSGAGVTPMMFATLLERKSMIALFEAYLAGRRGERA